ncbi:MAG: hypothetical protein LQ342_007688 [Letrouitia transgressa]|nr:MAG: hypothetical protein LQ342_007688 [Letrouitia transgressa]
MAYLFVDKFQIALVLSGFLVSWVVVVIIYRLYLHPAAKFAGPRVAALTYFYEFYYDVWQGGQYTWKIRDLHKQYVKKVEKLCTRLEQKSYDTIKIVSITHAFVALTLDIISRVCFGYSYETLEPEEFAQQWYHDMSSASRGTNLVRHFPWVLQFVAWLPKRMTQAAVEGVLVAKKRRLDFVQRVTAVVERHAQGQKPPNDVFTVFDAMLDADVPHQEKSIARLSEEAQTTIAAGTLTTANALDATIYYLLSNSECLSRLREELHIAMPDPALMPSFVELERLPYLTAVVSEGLRLSKGVLHRLARVSPDVPYRHGNVVIPRGIAVSMSSISVLEHTGIFPDPHAFKPERWLPLDAPEVRQRRKSLIVFGGGSRMCVGLHLAWAELYLTVAAVVRRFGGRLSLHDVVFERDVKITVDGFNALPSHESKGLRVFVAAEIEKENAPARMTL